MNRKTVYTDDVRAGKTGSAHWKLKVLIGAKVRKHSDFDWLMQLEHAGKAFVEGASEVKSEAVLKASATDNVLESILHREMRSISIHIVDIFICMEELFRPIFAPLFPGTPIRTALFRFLGRAEHARHSYPHEIAQRLLLLSKQALVSDTGAASLLHRADPPLPMTVRQKPVP